MGAASSGTWQCLAYIAGIKDESAYCYYGRGERKHRKKHFEQHRCDGRWEFRHHISSHPYIFSSNHLVLAYYQGTKNASNSGPNDRRGQAGTFLKKVELRTDVYETH
jgi:hypothetical protein